MLLPRKKRHPLLQKRTEEETYPTLMVALEENSSPKTTYEVSVVDINATGMGITSTVPLNVGQSVFFENNQPEWDLPKYGVVMWTFHDPDGMRAGIKFA